MRKRFMILSLLGIFATGIAVFAVNWRSGYEIRKITVTGNSSLSRSEVLGTARLKDSVITETDAGIDLIRDRLLNHPVIRSAFVSKNPPSELKIEIVEKKPLLILNSGSELFLADEQLEVYPFRQSAGAYDLPIVSGVRTEPTHNPLNRFNREDLRYALFLVMNAAEISKMLYTGISEINLSDPGTAIIYLAEDSSPVYFPREEGRSISDESYREYLLGKLKIFEKYLKQSHENLSESGVKYVDLRYSNQVIVNSNP